MKAALAEVWKPIKGHDGYEVSSSGLVRSHDRWVNNRHGTKTLRKGRVLSQSCTKGYWVVGIRPEGSLQQTMYKIHNLVLIAFVGDRPDGMQACHGPNGKDDNSVPNLRWDTNDENIKDIKRHGNRRHGEQMYGCKLKEHEVIDIKNTDDPHVDAAKRYNVTPTLISLIRRGKAWSYLNA